MIAFPPGRTEPSKTRWIPWLGAMSGARPGSASRRTASQKGPPALITTRAAAADLGPALGLPADDAVHEAVPVRVSRSPARS